eukprot:236102_1
MVLEDFCLKVCNELAVFRRQPHVNTLDKLIKTILSALQDEDVNMKNENILTFIYNIRKTIKQLLKETQLVAQEFTTTVEKIIMDELIKLFSVQIKAYEPIDKKINTYLLLTVCNNHKIKALTIGKIGHYYLETGWNVGVICADTFGSKILYSIIHSPICIQLNVTANICQIICYYLPESPSYNMCRNVNNKFKIDCYGGNYEKDNINEINIINNGLQYFKQQNK